MKRDILDKDRFVTYYYSALYYEIIVSPCALNMRHVD